MKTALSFLMVSGTLWAFASCASEPPAETRDSPLKTAKREDYFVVARFMDEGTLKGRYGPRFNPFISIRRLATPRRFMTFKLNFEQIDRTIVVSRRRMLLQMGGKSSGAASEFYLLNYWEREDADLDIMPADQRRRTQHIRNELLPETIKLPPGGRTSGLVVFSDNYPPYGKAILYLPVLDENEREIERLEFSFEF